MKQSLLILLLFCSLSSFAQTVPDSTQREQYCIVRTHFSGPRNLVASADYGQKPSRRLFDINFIKDEEGKTIYFNSEVDVLNYFGWDGWKLVNAFPEIERGSSYTRYIFKRTER